MMTRRQATVGTVTALLQNPAMMLILGVITRAGEWSTLPRALFFFSQSEM
jgi:hypothetical protein